MVIANLGPVELKSITLLCTTPLAGRIIFESGEYHAIHHLAIPFGRTASLRFIDSIKKDFQFIRFDSERMDYVITMIKPHYVGASDYTTSVCVRRASYKQG